MIKLCLRQKMLIEEGRQIDLTFLFMFNEMPDFETNCRIIFKS